MPAEGLIDDSGYTVAMLVRIVDAFGHVKLFDTKAGTADPGLYALDERLILQPVVHADDLTDLFESHYWHQIAFVREGSGRVRGYVDGRLQFVATDNVDASKILQPQNMLRFLADDSETVNQNNYGAVARIRLWNEPLSSVRLANLDGNQGDRIFVGGFEAE